jgi:hypothetical protein
VRPIRQETAQRIVLGSAAMQARSMGRLAVEAPAHRRLAIAFDELAVVI